MKFRKSAHAIYKTEYHLVWIPRYRRKMFVKGVKEYTEKLLSHIPELDPDIEVVKLNVLVDHVHMVVVIGFVQDRWYYPEPHPITSWA